jgi:hypothetical protein
MVTGTTTRGSQVQEVQEPFAASAAPLCAEAGAAAKTPIAATNAGSRAGHLKVR